MYGKSLINAKTAFLHQPMFEVGLNYVPFCTEETLGAEHLNDF